MTHAAPQPAADTRSDEDLLRAFARGRSHSDLAELAHRYEEPLLGLASGLLSGDGALAADAVQDAWLRVIRHAGSFRSRSSVKTWLYRIVINRCLDLRTKERRSLPLNGAAGSTRPAEPPASGAAPRAAPDTLSDTAPHTAVRAAMDALPENQRVILLLCYHRGLTHEQAAEVLGIPLGTLKSRQHAAITALRTSLGEQNP